MNLSANRKSKLAICSLGLGALAIILPMLGGLGTRAGFWAFSTGLLFTPAGLLTAIIGLLLGLVAVLRLRKNPGSMPYALGGAGVSALTSFYLGSLVMTVFSVPPIHNISTDVEDPPAFTAVASLRGEGDNPLTYDSETIGPAQRGAYPEIVPLVVDAPVDQVYQLARGALTDMGLELVREAPDQGEIEAVATTFWFGFKDDIVVRLRETEGGTRMDVRSVSRVGISDLGVNAERIAEIISRVEAAR